jgi:hypothetical protein
MIEWRACRGYPNYEVSNEGDVRNIRSGLQLKPMMNPRSGYLQVILRNPDKPKRETLKIHRLVAIAFLPNPLDLPAVNHIGADGNKKLNTVENLEWVTHAENHLHRARILRKCAFENHGMSKLTPEQVQQLRSDARSSRAIAHDYPVNARQIRRIRSKENWADNP